MQALDAASTCIVAHNTVVVKVCRHVTRTGVQFALVYSLHDCSLPCDACRAGGNLSPDIISYNSLFRALIANDELAHAFTLLTGIENYGPQPTSTTYDLLFEACVAAGEHEQALRAWSGLVRSGSSPSTSQFNNMLTSLVALVRAWCCAGLVHGWPTVGSMILFSLLCLCTVLSQMRRRGRGWTAVDQCVWCCTCSRHAEGLREWQHALSAPEPGLEYVNLECTLQARWRDAWQLFSAATSLGGTVVVDGNTVQLIAEALAPQLPPRATFKSAQAAPMLSALQHIVQVAAAVSTAPPNAALLPLLDALIQRGDWRAAVVTVGNIVHTHGAHAALDALQELPALLHAAQQQELAGGRAAEAEQLRSAASLVRFVHMACGFGMRC